MTLSNLCQIEHKHQPILGFLAVLKVNLNRLPSLVLGRIRENESFCHKTVQTFQFIHASRFWAVYTGPRCGKCPFLDGFRRNLRATSESGCGKFRSKT